MLFNHIIQICPKAFLIFWEFFENGILGIFGHFHTIIFRATCGDIRWIKDPKNAAVRCIILSLLSALTWNYLISRHFEDFRADPEHLVQKTDFPCCVQNGWSVCCLKIGKMEQFCEDSWKSSGKIPKLETVPKIFNIGLFQVSAPSNGKIMHVTVTFLEIFFYRFTPQVAPKMMV